MEDGASKPEANGSDQFKIQRAKILKPEQAANGRSRRGFHFFLLNFVVEAGGQGAERRHAALDFRSQISDCRSEWGARRLGSGSGQRVWRILRFEMPESG